MSLLMLPFRAVGWVLMLALTTAIRTVVTLATIAGIVAAVYFMGGMG